METRCFFSCYRWADSLGQSWCCQAALKGPSDHLWLLLRPHLMIPGPGEESDRVLKLVAVVCLQHGFQAGAGLQEISKAAHLLLLKWPIQHFCVLFRWILNDSEGDIVYKNDLPFIHYYISTALVKLLLAFDHWFFFLIVVKYTQHKVYNFHSFSVKHLVSLGTFTLLCGRHSYSSLELFSFPKLNLCTH